MQRCDLEFLGEKQESLPSEKQITEMEATLWE